MRAQSACMFASNRICIEKHNTHHRSQHSILLHFDSISLLDMAGALVRSFGIPKRQLGKNDKYCIHIGMTFWIYLCSRISPCLLNNLMMNRYLKKLDGK